MPPIIRESAIVRTSRVQQVEGIFDIPLSERSAEVWNVDLKLPEKWNIGLIVGPSGSGKTTVARELFDQALVKGFDWDNEKSILDSFPERQPIKDITELLSSVGFSSPPSWLRPFHVLSNGEQFRVTVARALAEQPELVVMDEFTSVVDRTVAQIGSAAVAKTVRRRNQKFIAVACHYDIAEWLEPDWIYQPHINELQIGRSLRRPEIKLTIRRVHHSAWRLFRQHHYLDTDLNTSATCFCAFWNDTPVAFTAVLAFPHPKVRNIKREHRTVTLPDYQGVGIGNALSAYIGSMCKALGYRFVSTTSHPAMIRARNASKQWSMTKAPALNQKGSAKAMLKGTFANDRLTAAFEYCGRALDKEEALRVWS